MEPRAPTGLQIAFLVFAVTLVAVPLTDLALRPLEPGADAASLAGRTMPFVLATVALLAIAPLRRAARAYLAQGLDARGARETAVVAAAAIVLPFAIVALQAAWAWSDGGVRAVERLLPLPEAEAARAFSAAGMATMLLLGALVAPVIEELVFRGFLHDALERRRGWIVAMLASATLFALYHRNFADAFLTSLVFTCVRRRTGSLLAPIVVHATGNLVLWWPLAGRVLLPGPDHAGDPGAWSLHFACLAAAAIALPAYLWMARHPRDRDAPATRPLDVPAADAAVPR